MEPSLATWWWHAQVLWEALLPEVSGLKVGPAPSAVSLPHFQAPFIHVMVLAQFRLGAEGRGLRPLLGQGLGEESSEGTGLTR